MRSEASQRFILHQSARASGQKHVSTHQLMTRTSYMMRSRKHLLTSPPLSLSDILPLSYLKLLYSIFSCQQRIKRRRGPSQTRWTRVQETAGWQLNGTFVQNELGVQDRALTADAWRTRLNQSGDGPAPESPPPRLKAGRAQLVSVQETFLKEMFVLFVFHCFIVFRSRV